MGCCSSTNTQSNKLKLSEATDDIQYNGKFILINFRS